MFRKLIILFFVVASIFVSCSNRNNLYIGESNSGKNLKTTIEFCNDNNFIVYIAIGKIDSDNRFKPVQYYAGEKCSKSVEVLYGVYYLAYTFYDQSGKLIPWNVKGCYEFAKDNYYTISFKENREYKKDKIRDGEVIVDKRTIMK